MSKRCIVTEFCSIQDFSIVFQTLSDFVREPVNSQVTGRFDALGAKQNGYDREEQCDKWKMTWSLRDEWSVTNQYGKESVCVCAAQRKTQTERDRGNCCVMESNGGRQTAGVHRSKVYTSEVKPKRRAIMEILRLILSAQLSSLQSADLTTVELRGISFKNDTFTVYFQQSQHEIICLLWKV